ncbi:hypothetical protein FGG79_19665 [Bacillus sp. BHET2]|nr:hypothetical protein FGG79_19665 [Bacillus sp. BHET2]
MQGSESFVIVGLPDASVKESKERVTAALHGMGYTLVNQKVIINLSPSELKKTGPLYDLPMALGVLLSMKEITVRSPDTTAFLGALSLDGGVRAVEGMLPAVLTAKKVGVDKIYMPFDEEFPYLKLKACISFVSPHWMNVNACLMYRYFKWGHYLKRNRLHINLCQMEIKRSSLVNPIHS